MTTRPCPARGCGGDDGNPVLTSDPMCDRHTAAVASALADLPGLYVELAGSIEPSRAATDDRVRISRGAPLPINVAARALQEDSLALLLYAEVRLRRAKGWSAATAHGRELPTLRSRAGWVRRHLTDILTQDVRVGLELLRIKTEARRVLGKVRLIHRLPAPCPECDCMGLERADGSSWVRCRACGLAFGEDAYGVLVRVLAAANPTVPVERSHDQCSDIGPRSGRQCRIVTDHRCAHLTHSGAPTYTEWETWR